MTIFLDNRGISTSPVGEARILFQLGEAGLLKLVVDPHVLRECEAVVRRKAPASLPILAQLLEIDRVETTPAPAFFPL